MLRLEEMSRSSADQGYRGTLSSFIRGFPALSVDGGQGIPNFPERPSEVNRY